MLDLTQLTGQLYQVKLLDGTVLNLKRPTQGLYEAVAALGDDTELAMKNSIDLLTMVLNRNDAGIIFDKKDIARDYDFSIALVVISDYMNYYVKEVQEQVNFLTVQQQ
jgi:hypothetical protein